MGSLSMCARAREDRITRSVCGRGGASGDTGDSEVGEAPDARVERSLDELAWYLEGCPSLDEEASSCPERALAWGVDLKRRMERVLGGMGADGVSLLEGTHSPAQLRAFGVGMVKAQASELKGAIRRGY
jgi:hypothetical protein